MATYYAGCRICDLEVVPTIERKFFYELLGSDYKNVSFTEHLEHYSNPNWTEENSFCMDDDFSFGSMEVYSEVQGLCFILNSPEKIYSER